MTEQHDKVLRAMMDDGSFRVLTADTTETVRAVLNAQEVGEHSLIPAAAVITASVLVRETMAPDNRVQVIYRDRLGSQLVGDAHKDGKTRGLVRIKDEVLGVLLGEGGIFQVERVMRAGELHQGIIQTDEGDDITAALKRYFLESEQVTSMVDLACTFEDGELVAAGGYVVQLLPEVTDPPLEAMEQRLAKLGALSDFMASKGSKAELTMAAVLGDTEHCMLADDPVMFHCQCDRDRVRGAAAALGEQEILDLMMKEEDLSISCHYCCEKYSLGVEDYRKILDSMAE